MPTVHRRQAHLACNALGCRKMCKTTSGLKRHQNQCKFRNNAAKFRSNTPPPVPLKSLSCEPSAPAPDIDTLDTPDADTDTDTVPPIAKTTVQYHPIIDGTPCSRIGADLHDGTAPSPPPDVDKYKFDPFTSCADFEFAEFLYKNVEMSGGNLDKLSEILAALYPGQEPPFENHKDLYATIDSVEHGASRWKSFSVSYNGEIDLGSTPPSWMTATYEVWYRDPLAIMEKQLANPDFCGKIDYGPKLVHDNGTRQYTDFMSGNWAWREANKIAEDEACDGAMLVPVILGSDKTTVSVATGNNEFYPLYGGIGNVHNNVRRAHRDAVSLIALLAIPKTSREYQNNADFRKFRRQLFHTSLYHILRSLQPYMTCPRVSKCSDGHFRRAIYSLGPYIADYPEQALLACIVSGWCPKCTALNDHLDLPGDRRFCEHTAALQEACTLRELWDNYGIVGDLIPFTSAFPRADIYEMLSMDLLHQVIKGTFKDHLVEWVVDYINAENSKPDAARILADIDRRIAAAPPFPGLRRFPEGRNFKQWTGDDSKALMKVFIPAIAGRVPDEMVAAIRSFTEFCYMVRRSVISQHTITSIRTVLNEFHQHRAVFKELGIRDDFNLPRQHSIFHYPHLIEEFGAPNGLCSSITENKHIKAIKKPWRRSSRHKALQQILMTNQRLDKLAASRIYFESYGMLVNPNAKPPPEDPPTPDNGPTHGEAIAETILAKRKDRSYPHLLQELGPTIGHPELERLVREFLYDQVHCHRNDNDLPTSSHLLPSLPVHTKVNVYPSAISTFYAPSDFSGTEGMHHERIRAMPKWHNDIGGRYDTVFLSNGSGDTGFRGLHVARLRLLFSFNWKGETYPCALIRWFSPTDTVPDPITGLWVVEPDMGVNGHPFTSVVHLDTIFRGAHLLGVAGSSFLPESFAFHHTLDAFSHFYVNKYADYHAHETAF
ncbi:hypothetical protein BDN71DRAFT_1400860 [Pleurotus eryngii]|uniref:C2H2-type domain-containing protein n=1 Tax=Pleurotus eryngii TaxID=5323 RepID=A0A9P6DBV0_PLEER|nr:hypothetical protein BDN71DRAFT_1400860 [Pleurotus eryngii]